MSNRVKIEETDEGLFYWHKANEQCEPCQKATSHLYWFSKKTHSLVYIECLHCKSKQFVE